MGVVGILAVIDAFWRITRIQLVTRTMKAAARKFDQTNASTRKEEEAHFLNEMERVVVSPYDPPDTWFAVFNERINERLRKIVTLEPLVYAAQMWSTKEEYVVGVSFVDEEYENEWIEDDISPFEDIE